VGAVVATPLLLIGGLMDGMTRTVLWAIAAFFDVSTAWILRGRLAQVRLTPLHYTHRYGLLLILVLGESVIAVGAVAATEPLTPVRLTTIGLSYVLACALWWTYFVYGLADFRRAMARADRQAELRRSVLAYGHLLFSFGIVAVAVGLSEAVAQPLEHLRKSQVALLFAGSGLFLSTFAYTHWRIHREIAWRRVAAGVTCLILMPLSTHIPAVSALTLLVLVVVTVSLSEQLIIRRQRPGGGDRQRGRHEVSGTSAAEPDSNADNVDAGPPVHREDS
jgi:low temperature requirement protein LtrA